jgi:hypothetical protein
MKPNVELIDNANSVKVSTIFMQVLACNFGSARIASEPPAFAEDPRVTRIPRTTVFITITKAVSIPRFG